MRATTWGLEAGGFTGLVAAATTQVALQSDYEVSLGLTQLARYTITRMVGAIYFRADAVPASDIVQEAAFGIGVFNENLPAASFPNPRNENANWMWNLTYRWVPWTVEASAGVFRQLLNVIPFDIKTQRILRGTESQLQLVVSNIIGEDLDVEIRVRNLWRVP